MKHYLGPIVFLLLIGNQIRLYGTRWEFGPYGVPTILLAPDGIHYLDGSRVDPLSLYLKVSGQEQGVMLALICFIAFCILCIVRITNNTARMRREIAELKRFTHELERRKKRC